MQPRHDDYRGIRSPFLALVCLLVTAVVLTLGLWPFHSTRNDVRWLEDRNGLSLGRNATLSSDSTRPIISHETDPEISIEIWLQPRLIWDSGTLLSFYQPSSAIQFSLRQNQRNLILQLSDIQKAKKAVFTADRVFKGSQATFVTISSGKQGCFVYNNGSLAAQAAHFRLPAGTFAGRLIVGDSPRQPDSWSGNLLGIAIYRRQLTDAQVLRHYYTWTNSNRPVIIDEDRNAALYLFDEHSGSVVHNKVGSGLDLYIPPRYQVIDKAFLEPVRSEFGLTKSYGDAALKNVVGFMPFGFCFYAWMSGSRLKRPMLATVALGTTTSLAIEVLQYFLPTRDSGTTDLITNTLGTWIGAATYLFMRPAIVRWLPWLAERM